MAGNMNRVAYFVPAKKREGMFVGPCNPDQLESLINVIKEAQSQGKGVVFFLWKNEPSETRKSVATLTVAVAQDRAEASPSRRPIGNAGNPAPSTNDPLAGLMGSKKPASKGW